MAAQLRAIRQRISAIKSTAKITRAQELIAASRIIKAQQRMRAATPYANEIQRAMEAVVTRSASIDHPLVRQPGGAQRAAILILTSDRGFAGGYNANVLREAQRLRAMLEEQGIAVDTYVSGNKGIAWHRFRQRELAGQWSGFSEDPAPKNATEITAALLEAFERPTAEGGVDELHLVHTTFISMLSQRPSARRMLPLEVEEVEGEPATGAVPLYEFEPSPQAVLDALLPWYVENRIYYALLESAAAEIAARRRAMKSATDNANDLLDQFTREANKARQAEITQEISEIVGGANALAETYAGSE
jgi:F-type H+-transporting ATPase subunit gamma